MAFVDITEENIQNLFATKDSTQAKRQVTRSREIFRDFLASKNAQGTDFKNFNKANLN